ncbi:hypothetical protein AB3R30_24475 [Leptolyngbyaceae cyanobacterium UHCC 1019]
MALSKVAKKQTGRSRREFSYKAEDGTTVALLIDYFNGKLASLLSIREGKRRALEAMAGFWQAYALRASGAETDQQKEAARYSITVLSQQIRAICEDFGVVSPFTESLPTANANSTVLDALMQLLQSGSSTQHVSPLKSASESTQNARSVLEVDKVSVGLEAIYVDDDELLGDLA